MMIDPQQARQVLLEQLGEDGGGERATETKTLVLLSYLRGELWDEAIIAARDLIADDDQNWDAYTLLGGAFAGKGDNGQAREAYRQALKLRPGNMNAANNLARIEVKAGNFAAARELYDEMLAQNPDEVAPVLYLNALDQQEGKLADAQARLESAIAKHPKETALKLALARLYLSTGQPSLVLAMSYELTAEEANSPAMLQVLGDAQFALGEPAAAAAAYEKLVRQVPDVATLHYLLGRAYASAGRVNAAYEQLQEAVQIDPEHYASKMLRIQLLRLENKSAQASQLLAAMDSEFGERPEVLVEKGWLALYEGDLGTARQAFNAAFEVAPINDLVVQLGVVDWNDRKPRAAIERYKQWLEKNPDDQKILIHLANTYLQLGRDSEAVKSFEKLRKLNPDNTVVLNNLAWLLRRTDPGKAMEYAERTLELAPDWGAALDTLGSIQLEQGDLDRAARSFEQALKRSPGSPDIHYHLAVVSSRRGDNSQAIAILKAILADRDKPFASRKEAEQLLASLQ
ncbi:MAG: PEP-CTERM system TPR-repeat protein PrsT [Halioglobus sp.]|nr:PEP-CTERM system TPR-repeat protein PrsT [Halioglobus sp.]